MTRISFYIIACLILWVQFANGRRRPHICFVFVDDWGWNDVSFHGSRQIPTPNIDALAANSIVLNNYYVQPMCTPSRAALMTGRHPIEYGLHHLTLRAAQPAGLSLNMTLLPQHLKNLGYSTHLIGKWHLGLFKKEYTPQHRGFDSSLGYWVGHMGYYNHTTYEPYPNDSSIPYGWGKSLRRNMEYADDLAGKYATNLFTEEAERIIDSHDPSNPLFLYMSHLAVHTGNVFKRYEAPMRYVNEAKHIQDNNRRVYAGMVIALDESIGKLFGALEKKEMLDNTIFVVTTDNGGEIKEYRGAAGSNWPLRGSKICTWEGGIRGTAFVWSRLFKNRRRISNQFMHVSDWLPTLYRAAGGNTKDLGGIYGKDLWNALSHNTPSPRTELLVNIDPVSKVMTLRVRDYKLVIGSNLEGTLDGWYGPTGRDNGISPSEYQKRISNCEITDILKRKGWYKEVTDEWLSQLDVRCKPLNEIDPENCVPTITPCLFNITNDPCEQNNIAEENPRIVEDMMERLEVYKAMVVPIVNETLDPRADPKFFDDHWTNWAEHLKIGEDL